MVDVRPSARDPPVMQYHRAADAQGVEAAADLPFAFGTLGPRPGRLRVVERGEKQPADPRVVGTYPVLTLLAPPISFLLRRRTGGASPVGRWRCAG
jgi:hypothetical protein